MYYAIVVFAVAATALGPGRTLAYHLPTRVRHALERPAMLPFALVALLAAQHAFLALLLDASYQQTPDLAVLQRMPVRIVNDFGGPIHIASSYGDRFAALALVECLGLAAVYHALRRPRPWQLALVGVAALAACADAFGARACTSADMYAYVGFALLGKHAYAPPHVAFSGAFSVINTWWGMPMVPAPYGPLWLAVAGVVASTGPTLLAKIMMLRLLDAASLLAVVALLAALGFPARITALVALNPALLLEFVANVHNDLFAVALVLAARLAAQRGAVLATIVLAVLAVLVKLPFLLFAALAFVSIHSRRSRVALYLATAAAAVGASWLWGGPTYFAALFHLVNQLSAGHAYTVFAHPTVLVKAAALAGVVLALVCETRIEGLAWTLPAISTAMFPWYLSWGLPYAILSEDMLRNFAIALPLVTIATDTALGDGTLIVVLQLAAYCWLAIQCTTAVAAHRRSARLPAT